MRAQPRSRSRGAGANPSVIRGARTLLSVESIAGRWTTWRSLMASMGRPGRASIFSPATAREREANFESYWLYQQRRDGGILEDVRDLAEKQKTLLRFQQHAV